MTSINPIPAEQLVRLLRHREARWLYEGEQATQAAVAETAQWLETLSASERAALDDFDGGVQADFDRLMAVARG